MNLHSNEKPWQCKFCAKRFPQQSACSMLYCFPFLMNSTDHLQPSTKGHIQKTNHCHVRYVASVSQSLQIYRNIERPMVSVGYTNVLCQNVQSPITGWTCSSDIWLRTKKLLKSVLVVLDRLRLETLEAVVKFKVRVRFVEHTLKGTYRVSGELALHMGE
jgi:hypothetical protein